jgi:hypothetical protein
MSCIILKHILEHLKGSYKELHVLPDDDRRSKHVGAF